MIGAMIRVFGVPQTPAWVAVLLVGTVGRADVVRTTDGQRLAGTVAVEGHALRVGQAVVALDHLLDVTFDHRVRTGAASCVLVDGSTLVGRIDGIDDKSVRVTTAAVGSVPVAIGRVARVCFGPVDGDLLGRVPGGAAGLLLRDGDFFEGTLVRFDGAGVTMTSPLLGEATFATADRAAALVLRPAGPRRGDWVVRTTDGSVLAADGLSVTGGAVRMNVDGVGAMAVRLSDLGSVRAGGDRVVELADVKPTAGTALSDATPVGLPAHLIGGAVNRAVCVSGGTSVTYGLAGGYTAFACRVGVPSGVVPMAGVAWSIALDGRRVADGGGPRTSVDDPVAVVVPTAGARELTLSVEPVAGGVGALVLFAEPVLARRAGATTGRAEKSEVR